MYKAHGMNGVQREHHLSRVEPRPLLGNLVAAHEIDEIAAGHVVHHHIEVFLVLEGIVQLDRKQESIL